MARKNKIARSESNRNAYILHENEGNRSFTFTKKRDADTLKVSARTDVTNNSTKVVITRFGGDEKIVLTGHEARTLQRVLNKHYGENY
jgi:hypothetical protein